MNQEFPDVQAGFRKGRGTRDKFANTHWIIEKQKCSKKTSICFIDYAKAFDCVDQQIVENSSRDENSRPHDQPPEKLICRSRSNSWNQAWTDRPVPNWERLYMSPNLFNFYAEYIK